MDNIKATATLFHDKRTAKKNGVFPVKVTIYYNGEKKRYKTGIDLSVTDWAKINKENLRDDGLKITKRKLNAFAQRASDIISSISAFSFEAFEAKFFPKTLRKTATLKDLFDNYIRRLEENDQIGTAISYRTTINSLIGFAPKLKITDVTKEFLGAYERHMMQRNASPSTIGIYLRQLRRIVNIAIADGLLAADRYPFKGYQIPSSRNVKKALSESQIVSLLNYQTEDVNKRKALDFWLFSYVSNGINMGDICLLQRKQVDGNFFHYFRAKTKNTKKKDLRPIKVPLSALSITIIDRWKNLDVDSPYLFPVLHAGLNAKQIKYKIQDFIYFVNKQMKKVAEDLGISVQIGTYVARHTHSTILKRKGVSTEFIKENLGHSSVSTTESYLGDFTDDIKLEYAELLTNFK